MRQKKNALKILLYNSSRIPFGFGKENPYILRENLHVKISRFSSKDYTKRI